MPVDLVETSTFASPVTVPVDGDPLTASSIQAPLQSLTNRTLFNKNRLASFVPESGPNAGRYLYDATQSDVRTYGVGDFKPDVPADWQTNFATAGSILARPVTDDAIGVFHCTDFPEGCEVQFVDIMCQMNSARAGTDRWGVRVFQKHMGVPATISSSEVGTVTYGGSTSLDRILVGPMSVGMTVGSEILIVVIAPTGSLGVSDVVYGARVYYETQRPRV